MFACIYIPDFPVEAIVRAEPLLRERAVAVLDGKPPVVRIMALNERGRQMGMEVSMTKLQAAIFSDAVLRPRSREQEKSAHSALLDVAFGFAPRVEDAAQDRVLLDLCGMERMHGSAANMARELASRVNATGLEANVAVAGNPDSAMHAACGFTGTTVIPAGEEARRLGVLSLHVLLDSFDLPRAKSPQAAALRERERLREQMLDTLERWGVRDFRTLALLPEHALASRLGQAGARLQRLARGEEMRTLTLSEPESRFEEAFELEFPVENLEPLSFILNRLLEQLCARLESRALAAHELNLRLQLERRVADEETTTAPELSISDNVAGKPVFERRLRLPVAMRDAKVFLKLLQLDLAAHPPGAPILKLWISAQPAPPRSAQRGLFLPLTPEAEKLEITLARIISIVGEHRAGIARLLDTHRPDAFTVERFAAPEESPGQTLTLSEVADSDSPSYALRIFRPAQRLRVRVADGRPTAIQSTTQPDQPPLQGKVLWSAGPWRCSGEWWEERTQPRNHEPGSGPWDREEWDIALQNRSDDSIGLYRIYQDVDSGQWFAHASYD
ncbi:MAG: DNA polymerase Y family protein [Candidatus Korobacteraceae bacterium]